MNITTFEEHIGSLISNLHFTDEEMIEIDARLKTDVALFEEKRLKDLESNDRRKRKIREDLIYLRTNKLDLLKIGTYAPEEFLSQENELNKRLVELQEQERVSDVSMHETVKELLKLSELLKNIDLYYSFADHFEKERIIKTIFSELKFSEDTLEYKCRNGFKAFEKRFLSLGDPTGSRTRLPRLKILCPN